MAIDPLRILVVGAGNFGRHHLQALAKLTVPVASPTASMLSRNR
jgi:predicted dehydrogenase